MHYALRITHHASRITHHALLIRNYRPGEPMQNVQSMSSAERVLARTRTPNASRRAFVNVVMNALTFVCSGLALGLLLYLLLFLLFKGAGAISWGFLTSEAAAVGEEGGGIAASLTGTAIIVTIAAVLAVPIGVLIGVYLSEMAQEGNTFAIVTRVSVNSFLGIP